MLNRRINHKWQEQVVSPAHHLVTYGAAYMVGHRGYRLPRGGSPKYREAFLAGRRSIRRDRVSPGHGGNA
jgi:hypothetical protein